VFFEFGRGRSGAFVGRVGSQDRVGLLVVTDVLGQDARVELVYVFEEIAEYFGHDLPVKFDFVLVFVEFKFFAFLSPEFNIEVIALHML